MYLSKLTLDLSSRQVQRDLGNLQDLHRTVMSAMPQAPDDAGGARNRFGVLFRLDARSGDGATILVQTQEQPQWSALPVGYLLSPAACKVIDKHYEAIRAGDMLAFRLLANPTRRATGKRTDGDKNESAWAGKRIELASEEDQIDWLIRQGARLGFEILPTQAIPAVLDVSVGRTNKLYGYRRGKGKMSFGAALFEGHLRVTDVDVFRDALTNGVGRGKAYGFGLLSVGPPRR